MRPGHFARENSYFSQAFKSSSLSFNEARAFRPGKRELVAVWWGSTGNASMRPGHFARENAMRQTAFQRQVQLQ